MRTAATSALVVPLAAVLVACAGTTATPASTPGPVRIGAIYNLTGDQSSLDAPSLDGARLAVDRINANGGLMGRRVELLERDGQTNEADVQRAAANLVASGCSAIIGLSDTDQVLAAAPIAASAGVPFVTSGATSPRLTKQVPNWLFLACFGDNAQAAASAQFATDQLGARTAAIIYGKDLEYTRLLAKYFERSFRAQGGKVVATTDFTRSSQVVPRLKTAGSPDRTPEASGNGDESGGGDSSSASSGDEGSGSSGDESAGSGAGTDSEASSGSSTGSESTATTTATASPAATASDATTTTRAATTTTRAAASADILYVAAGPSDAAAIVRRLRAAGYQQPIMGGDSFDSASLVQAAEKTGGKVYYTTHAAVGMSSASRAVRRFDASFQAAYGRPPQNAFASLGYDTVDLVASAIRRADSAKPSKVRDALQATRHFPGVTGTLSYDGKDRVPRKKVTIVCVGRRPVVVAQFTPGYVPRP